MTRRAVGILPTRAPVGVLAKTRGLAQSLAIELNLANAVALSPASNAGRGMNLAAILVDDSAWPMSMATRAALLPTLHRLQGYVLRVHRYDPKREMRW